MEQGFPNFDRLENAFASVVYSSSPEATCPDPLAQMDPGFEDKQRSCFLWAFWTNRCVFHMVSFPRKLLLYLPCFICASRGQRCGKKG
jgi:hypothetical protein